MILGRVVGEVWATRKHAALERYKLLLVRPYFWYDPPHESGVLVSVDTVGAGVGEDVVVCLGDGARRSLASRRHAAPFGRKEGSLGAANLPVDAAILGIVDRVELAADRGRRPLTVVGGGAPPAGGRWTEGRDA